MHPTVLAVIGPGFLNQVPTLGLLGTSSLVFRVFDPGLVAYLTYLTLQTRTLLVPSNRGIWPQIMGT